MNITDADREVAWPYADFHCLPDRQMWERWFSGYYDSTDHGHAIRAFAAHRLRGYNAGLEAAAKVADSRKCSIHMDEKERAAAYEHAERLASCTRSMIEGETE
jgi:hypothetical protein